MNRANDTAVRASALRQRLRRRTGRVVLAGAALLLALALLWALLPKAIPVDVAAARRGPMQVTVNEDGRTRVKDRYVVSAPLAGTLARITLDPGDRVASGDVLARIVPSTSPLLDPRSRAEAETRLRAAIAAEAQARAGVNAAQAALDFARKELASQRELFERKLVSRQALDRAELEERTRAEELTSARFAARVAAHQVELARVALGRGGERAGEEVEIRSPVEGAVLRVAQQSEGPVQAGAPLLDLGDPSRLEIVVDVLTTDAVRIEAGAPVIVERWGGGYPLSGRVRMVEPSAFTSLSALGVEEQRVNVIIDLLDPIERWRELGDGYRVETRVVVWRASEVLSVPESAVFRHGAGWAVYVVNGRRASLRPIEVGERSGVEVQVKAGVSAGERVVLYPGEGVRDGARVGVRRPRPPREPGELDTAPGENDFPGP